MKNKSQVINPTMNFLEDRLISKFSKKIIKKIIHD